jgi:hypothetical protein
MNGVITPGLPTFLWHAYGNFTKLVLAVGILEGAIYFWRLACHRNPYFLCTKLISTGNKASSFQRLEIFAVYLGYSVMKCDAVQFGRLLSTFRVNPCFLIQGRKVSCCCTTVQTGKSTSVQKVIFTCSVLCVSDHSYKSVQKVQTQVSVLLPSFIGPLPRSLWFSHSSFARSVPIVYSPS